MFSSESHLIKSPQLAKRPVPMGQKIKSEPEMIPDESWRDWDLVNQVAGFFSAVVW